MRLGQLARKLAVRPGEIVNFLAAQNIQIEEGTNTRIEEVHVEMIVAKFAPDQAETLLSTMADEPVLSEPLSIIPQETSSVVAEPTVHPTIENKSEETIELIKAPKIELSGLKVLGKIELPDTKKKELSPSESELSTPSDVEIGRAHV